MLRLLAFAAVFLTVLVIGMPENNGPQEVGATTGMEVRDDHGIVVGEIYDIVRDEHGRVIAARIEGLEEPADAPLGTVPVMPDDVREFLASNEPTEG